MNFWDTSAIVPLCVREPTSALVKDVLIGDSAGALGLVADMDSTRTLAAATRRYLAGEITLSELYDIECELIHQLAQLPSDHLEFRLMGAIELELAHMDAGVSTEDDLRAALEVELQSSSVVNQRPIVETAPTELAKVV